ncbi:MAG: hypothetical protein AAF657_23265 [Acidobacteriota bacterium]
MSTAVAEAATYFVSAERGRGREGTQERPVKNIGNLVDRLEPGDVINIAGGVYNGRSDAGWVAINVPVSIVGGWNGDFSERDPWGAHKTLLTGANKSENYKNESRLRIDLASFNRTNKLAFHRAGEVTQHPVLVDGIIIDNGGRNRYEGEQRNKIIRKANPKTGENPTPDGPALAITGALHSQVTVQNCVVVNCGSTQGALTVTVAEGGSGKIDNNLVANCTGTGIYARTSFHPDKSKEDLAASYEITHNTVLFIEKVDAFGTTGGDAFRIDAPMKVNAAGNVFAFSDRYGVNNSSQSEVQSLTLAKNLLFGNLQADMVEFDTKMKVTTWEDDSMQLSYESVGNVGTPIEVPVPSEWLEKYFARNIIDRAAAEADVKATDSLVNELRSILKLPQRAPDLNLDSDVWLPHMDLEAAIAAGSSRYAGEFGSAKP